MESQRKEVGGKLIINGKTFPIYGGVNTIGRNREAVVNIKSLGVSTQHAIFILVDDNLHFVSDLKSSNGTYLNNEKLDPLQLYPLDNGSHVKFADITGVYNKCTVQDVQHPDTTVSQNTQNFTQNFYGSDTQIVDNTTFVTPQNPSPERNYVSTQMLADVAEELENSIQVHESPTQVINTENLILAHESDTQVIYPVNSSNLIESLTIQNSSAPINTHDQLNVDSYEAETQVIGIGQERGEDTSVLPTSGTPNDIENHELETQEVADQSNTETSIQSIIGLHELEVDNEFTQDYSVGAGVEFTQDPVNSEGGNSPTNDGNTPRSSDEKDNEIASTSHMVNLDELSQENEVIKPLGLSHNIVRDTQDSNFAEKNSDISQEASTSTVQNLVELSQEEDVIRPLGLSHNILRDTQDPNFDKNSSSRANSQKTSQGDSQKASTSTLQDPNLSLEDEVIKPLGLSRNILDDSQDSMFEGISENMHKSKKELSNNDRSPKNEEPQNRSEENHEILQTVEKENSRNIFESQGSDADESSNDSLDFMTMQKIPSTQKYFGESTPEKKLTPEVQVKIPENSTKNPFLSSDTTQNSDSETDVEENNSVSRNNKLIEVRNSKGKKINNDSISGSDTDDGQGGPQKFECPDSDTDIEIDAEETKNDKSIGLVLEESALEDVQNSEKLDTSKNTPLERKSITRPSIGGNESLNDSDFIGATQEEHPKPISQGENSENSFKLGLTQLMEEENENTSQTSKQNESQGERSQNESRNSQDSQKKFTFSKSTLGATKSMDITLDIDEDIYQASTQKLYEGNSRVHETDSEGFLRPTQEAPKKTKQKKEEIVPEDDIYLLSTQKFDGSPTKKPSDDIYQQSTQKIVEDDPVDQSKKDSRRSDNEFYQLPTQKIPDSDGPIRKENNQDDDDIFATQVMDFNESPTKRVESELAQIFATQTISPEDDETLDNIQAIVLKKDLCDEKLPSEDKDLEAILCTQRMLDSPKSSKPSKIEEVSPGKSVESQLEVIFASQLSNLPPDKFVRPPNPLVNIFGEDTQNTEEILKEEKPPLEKDTICKANSTLEKDTSCEENESTLSRKRNQVGLEQSFALLQAQSTKIRRSKRNNDYTEITVSCPESTSRRSMVVAPNDKMIQEDEVKPLKNVRASRKRQPPTNLEGFVTDIKEPRKSKRKRFSETPNTSDEESEPDLSATSSKQKNGRRKLLSKIQEDEDELKAIIRPETSTKRSSRMQKNIEEKEKLNEYDETETKKIKGSSDDGDSDTSSRSSKQKNTKNKKLSKLQEDKNKRTTIKPETPTKRSSRMHKTEDINKFIEHETEAKKTISASDEEDTDSSSRSSKQKHIKNKKLSKIQDDENRKATMRPETPTKRISRMQKKLEEEKSSNENDDPENSNTKRKPNDKREDTSVGRKETKKKADEVENTSLGVNTKKTKKTEEISNSAVNTKMVNKITKKLKEDETPVTPTRTSKRGSTIHVTTPPKIRKVLEETPSSSRRRTDVHDTPNRTKRKLKPKVVFTMMENPKLESQIKQLGGSIVDSVDVCTVLLTKFVKRSMKLLSAVGLGKPICSEEWVLQSKKENDFVDPWDYILIDKEAEKKWDFSLKTSLERSLQAKLFEGYTFQLLVTNALDVLKGAIESCGGKIVTRTPKGASNFVVVASPDQKDKYKKLIKQQSNLVIVEPEAIFDGVLRQEIRFEKHLLK